VPPRSSPTSPAPSRSPSCSAIRPPTPPPASAPSVSPSSSPPTAIPAAAAPTNSSLGCAPRPTAGTGGGEADAKGELVRAFAAQLDGLVAAITRLSSRIAHEVRELPEGRIVQSFPRAAQITAELGDVRARFPTEAQLAAEAGVAPVTKAAGKSRGVVCRFACNERLRAAVTTFADNSRHASPWAAHIYQSVRARGCSHPHAIRVLARAWIRVLWRTWHDRKPYDPARHQAALQLA